MVVIDANYYYYRSNCITKAYFLKIKSTLPPTQTLRFARKPEVWFASLVSRRDLSLHLLECSGNLRGPLNTRKVKLILSPKVIKIVWLGLAWFGSARLGRNYHNSPRRSLAQPATSRRDATNRICSIRLAPKRARLALSGIFGGASVDSDGEKGSRPSLGAHLAP